MLTIKVKRVGENGFEDWSYTWQVGEPKLNFPDYLQIISVHASDKERQFIFGRFENIPIVNINDTTVWKQPWAQFIVDNL